MRKARFFVSLFLLAGGVYLSQPAFAAGTFTITVDPSSPPYQMAAAGSTNVAIGVMRFRATGEDIRLQQIEFTLTSGNLGSLVRATIWDGSTQVGVATFTGGNRHVGSSIIPVILPDGQDKLLTIRADFAQIGSGGSGVEGDLIRVDVDNNVNAPEGFSAWGRGVTSSAIIFTKDETSFAGARLFKSFPTFIGDPLPATGVADGKLLRFRVTAHPNGSIGISKFTLSTLASNAAVANVNLFAFTDSFYSVPLSGVSSGGALRTSDQTPNGAGEVVIFPQTSVGTQTTVQVPAGGTLYFEVRGNVIGQGGNPTVTTAVLGDLQYVQSGAMESSAGVESDPNNNFIWSPNAAGASLLSDLDWTNGTAVPGLPANGLTQVRSDAVIPIVVTIAPSSNSVLVGQSVTWTASVQNGTGNETFSWSGTDGLTGTGSSVQITYLTNGPKAAQVSVRSGAQFITSLPYAILVSYPQLSITPSVSLNGPFVPATAQWGVQVSGGDGNYTYSWTGSDNLSGNTQSVSITYQTAGVKLGRVTVTSGDGQSQTNATALSVAIPPDTTPVLTVSVNPERSSVLVGQVVNLTATASGGVGNYQFTWVDADAVLSFPSGTGSVSPVFGTSGLKKINVTVTSGTQFARVSAYIDVHDPVVSGLPPLAISVTVNPNPVLVGQNVVWDVTASGAGGAGSYTFAWSGSDSLSGTTSGVVHTYQTPGIKTGTITVTSGGQSATVTLTLLVLESGGVQQTQSSVRIEGPTATTAGASNVWLVVNSEPSLYSVDWKDGRPIETSQDGSFSHAYFLPGTYDAVFTISNALQNIVLTHRISVGVSEANVAAVFKVEEGGKVISEIRNPATKLFFKVSSRFVLNPNDPKKKPTFKISGKRKSKKQLLPGAPSLFEVQKQK